LKTGVIRAATRPPAILFQDRRFLVIDKPAGLPVHAGRAGGPSVEDFFPQWRVGGDGPWLAHRLDQDTAGCLVIALKKSALRAAQMVFEERGAEKIYWAVVRGVPVAAAGVIELPLAKTSLGRLWKMETVNSGDAAVTDWAVRGQGGGIAWLEFRPRTGRTHQVRAHAAALGHPIAGDTVYGGGGGRLMLLARAIRLGLDPPVAATAPVPAHMAEMMKVCGYAAQ
jgi:tRNA pseudouridine32 synthase/23S rRNA pseudouridine746 synthase